MTPVEPVNILLVDDQPAKLLSYEAILSELGENLIKAASGREALEILLKQDIALILIDVCMPDLDGFELAQMIREHPRFAKTALMFVSAVSVTELDLLKGYEHGAVDYMPVPIVPRTVIFMPFFSSALRSLEPFRLSVDTLVRVSPLTSVKL